MCPASLSPCLHPISSSTHPYLQSQHQMAILTPSLSPIISLIPEFLPFPNLSPFSLLIPTACLLPTNLYLQSHSIPSRPLSLLSFILTFFLMPSYSSVIFILNDLSSLIQAPLASIYPQTHLQFSGLYLHGPRLSYCQFALLPTPA